MEGTDSLDTKKCKDVYKDDLKIINFIYNYSQQLWKELTCNECQVNEKETESFLKDCALFHNCSQTHKNNTCFECNNFYEKVSRSFNAIKTENPRNICGEILENFNHVQTVWGRSHCNKKQKSSLTVFLAVSSALMLLPGIFYGGLAKQSYNQCSENPNEDRTRSEPVEGGSGSGEAYPKPSASNKKEDSEHDSDTSDEYSDNEEVILDLNDTKQELLKLSQQLEGPPKAGLTSSELLGLESSGDEKPALALPRVTNSQVILLDI